MQQLRIMAANGTLAQRLESVDAIPTLGEWAIEPKWDGIRLLAEVDETTVRFFSRSGQRFATNLSHIEQELLAGFPAGTWLDGEAVAIRNVDGKLVSDWGAAQSALSKLGSQIVAKHISFVVFDLLAHRHIDARPVPFTDRRRLLERAFAKRAEEWKHVRLTPQVVPASQKAHEMLVGLGFEGSVLKRLDAPYASGHKGHGQLRIKHVDTDDVVIMGFKPGKGGITGMVGAVQFGRFKDGQLVPLGYARGFDMATCRDMTDNPDGWLGRVIEVAYNGKTKNGLRHARMRRVRTDKTAEECVQ